MKRKAWRKNKIQDVEEALEDERLVSKIKRLAPKGKGSADGSELFTVDTKGSSEGLSRGSRRAVARAKIFPPKPPRIGFSANEEALVARAAARLAAGTKRRREEPAVFDLWAAPLPSVDAAVAAAEEEAANFKIRRTAECVPQAPPRTLHRAAGTAPAVLPAHEGQSMNPESGAFEELACMAAARELEREREEAALERRMRPMTHELREATGAEALKEMPEEAKVSAYRALLCPGAAAAGEEEGPGGGAAPGSKRSLRIKTQAKRNREKKRKNLDEQEAQRRAQRKLAKSVGEVGAMLKEMKEREAWLTERRAYRQAMRQGRVRLEATEGRVPACRRLGRSKFAEEAALVPDSTALGKALRSMPLKGSAAVKERVSSILRRGLLPPPPENSRAELLKMRMANAKMQRKHKFASSLMRDKAVAW